MNNRYFQISYLVISFISSSILSPQYSYFIYISLIIAVVLGTAYGIRSFIDALYFVSPLLCIFLCGAITGIGNELYTYLKDSWYVSKFCICIMLGYLLGRNCKLSYVHISLCISALAISSLHLSTVIDHVQNGQSLQEIRNNFAGSSIVVPLALAALLTLPKYLNKNIIGRNIVSIILSASLIVSLSRTYYLVFLSFIIPQINHISKYLKMAIFAAIFVISIIFFYSNIILDYENGFIGRIINSLDELMPSEYTDLSMINLNWRGFETYLVLRQYESLSLINKIFGSGFGSVVDIGFTMELSGNVFTELPIFHNGYIYVLLKTGLFGISMYFFFLYRLLTSYPTYNLHKISLSIFLVYLISTYIIAGPFNISEFDPAMILTGYYINISKRKYTGYE